MSKWTGWGLLLWFLFFPQAVKSGIEKGLELGGKVLVPSIFPYLVASGILVKTGALQGIAKKFKLGNLSENAKEMLIPSLFCGYPTGARLPALAYDNSSISKKEFTLLFLFANIPGFGFAVSYLGGIFESSLSGLLIYLSFVSASLTLLWYFSKKLPIETTAFLGNRREAKEAKETKETKETKAKAEQKLSEALVESISESAQTMVSLLFFVCFFSSLIDLLKCLALPAGYYPILASFLEITTGIFMLAQSYPMEVTVFFCAFSGLSVMFQSLYFDKKHAVNLPHLLIWRTVYGIVSVCYFIIFRFVIWR